MIQIENYYKPHYFPGIRKIWTFDDVEFPMRWIPAGQFLMGSKEKKYSGDSDLPEHEVIITRGFWMSETPITEKQYAIFKKGEDSNLPKNFVNLEDCLIFANYLSKKENLSCTLSIDSSANEILEHKGWRLPTEAEWEYACKAGVLGKTDKVLEKIAWYAKNSKLERQAVGQKEANNWGLYDMLGNIWEWTIDNFHDKVLSQGQPNPLFIDHKHTRILKGGGFYTSSKEVYAENRIPRLERDDNNQIGFRLVRAE